MKIRRPKEDLRWPIVRQGRRVGADAWRVWMKYEPPNYAQCLGCGVYITKVNDARFVLVHDFRTVKRSGRVVTEQCGTTFKLICVHCAHEEPFSKVRALDVPCFEPEVTDLYEDEEGQD